MTEEKKKQKVLLHVCCGPCAVFPIKILQQRGFEVTGYFFNPNVHPLQEYLRRAEAACEVADALGVRMIRGDREYDPERFLRGVVFREEHRCFLCYQARLEKTRNISSKSGFFYFTSTLLFSRKQKHEQIKSIGLSLSGQKCGFLYQDFRIGYEEGREAARAMGIYHQNYCGCIYSEFERFRGLLGSENNRPASY